MTHTLLAIHAHPDDESSKGAATVSKYASLGVRCILVTATGGEAGDILNPAMDRPEIAANLKAVREAELAEAAKIQGYDEVILLGYRDSGMPDSPDNANPLAFCNQPVDDVLERLVRIVRGYRPDVVLGYDAHEFYPHPDHLRVHDMSMRLFDAAADGARFPDAGDPWEIKKMYSPQIFTKTKVTILDAEMRKRTGTSPYEKWIDRLAEWPDVPAGAHRTRIDVTGFIDQGRDALRAHRTQIDPESTWFQVPTDLVEEIYPWEDFELMAARVPTTDGDDDLFNGIS
jgi:mycothiol S-conjugate amidase